MTGGMTAWPRAARATPGGPQGAEPPRSGNGAMIAWQGLLQLRAGAVTAVESSAVRPYERTDHVEVVWR